MSRARSPQNNIGEGRNRIFLPVMLLLTVLLASPAVSEASLMIDPSYGNIVIDTESGLRWYRDLNHFANMTIPGQSAAIEALNTAAYGGLTTWRRATTEDMESLQCTSSTPLYDYLSFFPKTRGIPGATPLWIEGVFDDPYESTMNPGYVVIPTFTIFYAIDGKSSQTVGTLTFHPSYSFGYGAWVVADGPTSVPEPSTLLLIGGGLVGLAASRKRFRKA